MNGCTFIPSGKEFEEFLRTIQENIHRYKNEKSAWSFKAFYRCDPPAIVTNSISCKKDRMRFVIFGKNKNLI